MRAILISSNQEERDFLGFALRHEGLQVHNFVDAPSARANPPERSVDMMIYCVNSAEALPEVREIRGQTQMPLMLIADPLTEQQHCDYLDEGVDTVLQRPVSLRLFVRYTKQLLRRAGSIPMTVLTPIVTERIMLKPSDRTVVVDGCDPTRLTQLEFRLLFVLMTNEGQVIPTEELVERVWGYSGDGNRELVRGLVRRLRRKVEWDTSRPSFIHNLPGVGYRFSEGPVNGVG